MARSLPAVGALAAFMGAAFIAPGLMARIETGSFSAIGLTMLSAGGILIASGLFAIFAGIRCARRAGRDSTPLPTGVRIALIANTVFLAFFALELSDRLIRQDGRLFYWSTFLFPPALLPFYGLLTARLWAWWVSRIAAALAVIWFLGFVVMIPFVDLRTDGVPVPWYGRLYTAGVSLAFAGILIAAYRTLGQAETRRYFGLTASPAPSPFSSPM